MSNLVTLEREKYQAVWAIDTYGAKSPGEDLLPVFFDMTCAAPGAKVLDAGCGSAKGGIALRNAGMDVTLCDLTGDGVLPAAEDLPFIAACLWDDLTILPMALGLDRFDYVYCCDVLEHIPTPFTMLVISRLLEVTKYGLFLNISTRPDDWGAFVGEALHQTVQPFTAWRDQIAAIGRLREARDLLISGCYYVVPNR